MRNKTCKLIPYSAMWSILDDIVTAYHITMRTALSAYNNTDECFTHKSTYTQPTLQSNILQHHSILRS